MKNNKYDNPQTIIENDLPIEKMFFYLTILEDKLLNNTKTKESKAFLESKIQKDETNISKLKLKINLNDQQLTKIKYDENRSVDLINELLEQSTSHKLDEINLIFIFSFVVVILCSLIYKYLVLLLIIILITYWSLLKSFKQQGSEINQKILKEKRYLDELEREKNKFCNEENSNNLKNTIDHKNSLLNKLDKIEQNKLKLLKTQHYINILKKTIHIQK